MKLQEYNQWDSQKDHRKDYCKNFKKKKEWVRFKTDKRTECERTGCHGPLKTEWAASVAGIKLRETTVQSNTENPEFSWLVEKVKYNRRKNTAKHDIMY